MGNHRLHRLAMNTITWASLCWAAILFPEELCNVVRGGHFLNYIADERRDYRAVGSHAEQVRHYILIRASGFFEHLTVECVRVKWMGCAF